MGQNSPAGPSCLSVRPKSGVGADGWTQFVNRMRWPLVQRSVPRCLTVVWAHVVRYLFPAFLPSETNPPSYEPNSAQKRPRKALGPGLLCSTDSFVTAGWNSTNPSSTATNRAESAAAPPAQPTAEIRVIMPTQTPRPRA